MESIIVIATKENKDKILKENSKQKKLVNLKFYTFEELKKYLFFDYDVNTITPDNTNDINDTTTDDGKTDDKDGVIGDAIDDISDGIKDTADDMTDNTDDKSDNN